jgi:GNAT superfamily N-acetyltransferase
LALTVTELSGRRGLARFVDVPWRLLDPVSTAWVPPLRMVVRDALDVGANPFYRHADRTLFVAERDGRTVGRVAAIENRAHNRHHGDRVGFFGFFDCAPDGEAASALLDAASRWLRGRNLTAVRGPVSPSMNHESGLLVEGFETPPAIMTPWNPRYYGDLVEAAGFGPVQDLLGYDIRAHGGPTVPDRVRRLAERTAKRTGVAFRTLDPTILEREARKVLDLYNDAWSGTWGFVPPSWDEFWHTAKDLRSVLLPEFSFVAEVNDEIVGFMLLARDINRVLRRVPSGRLWPTTVLRLALGLPRVQRGRIVLLGLRREYRNRGLFPLFAWEAARRAREIGFEGAEASWILADNESLTAPMAAMGLEPYKRWRIYEKPLK